MLGRLNKLFDKLNEFFEQLEFLSREFLKQLEFYNRKLVEFNKFLDNRSELARND